MLKDDVLEKVHAIRALMIAVGTGKRQIEQAAAEYVGLRGDLAKGLSISGMADPNGFQSLWDWLSYWKANGLATYQSRRDYVSSLYKPVIASLEAAQRKIAEPDEALANQTFSERHGYSRLIEPEITIREDAPQEIRQMIVKMVAQFGIGYDEMADIAARIGKHSWEPSETVDSQTSSQVRLRHIVDGWEWYHLYDFIERIAETIAEWQVNDDSRPEEYFEEQINGYFKHAGVGWQLKNGKITSRGPEMFEVVVHRATATLAPTSLRTAQQEIHEAIADLSRRPKPDVTGAIQHAMAALECAARAAAGDSNATLGSLISRYPGLIPKPLDAAVEKAWGYASERGRHIKEGGEPARGEAELIVGMAATVATYLAGKMDGRR